MSNQPIGIDTATGDSITVTNIYCRDCHAVIPFTHVQITDTFSSHYLRYTCPECHLIVNAPLQR